eukprot:6104707-Pleurochrysis_carterae.AAC.1
MSGKNASEKENVQPQGREAGEGDPPAPRVAVGLRVATPLPSDTDDDDRDLPSRPLPTPTESSTPLFIPTESLLRCIFEEVAPPATTLPGASQRLLISRLQAKQLPPMQPRPAQPPPMQPRCRCSKLPTQQTPSFTLPPASLAADETTKATANTPSAIILCAPLSGDPFGQGMRNATASFGAKWSPYTKIPLQRSMPQLKVTPAIVQPKMMQQAARRSFTGIVPCGRSEVPWRRPTQKGTWQSASKRAFS